MISKKEHEERIRLSLVEIRSHLDDSIYNLAQATSYFGGLRIDAGIDTSAYIKESDRLIAAIEKFEKKWQKYVNKNYDDILDRAAAINRYEERYGSPPGGWS